MLDKAMGFDPDAYVPDMEDSVPELEKQNARNVIASHLEKLKAVGPLMIPRVNSLESGLIEEDLLSVVGPSIDGVSVGKIRTAQDIHEISALITDLESKQQMVAGKISLIPWIETAQAVVHCHDICTASPRIVGVAFGAEDFTHDMGIERVGDESESELAFARNTLCIAARAAGILALDTPYFRFKDEPGLKRNVVAGKRCGFKGKFAIHPAQVAPINRAFSPTPTEIAHARRVVAAFEEAERSGRGSTSLEGNVIDVPVMKRAREVLKLAASVSNSEMS
jgi:citrate lyase subunit beta/citryl-CoA lyase